MKRSGFTLAEALAALLLVAMVMPAALNGIALGVRVARDARQRLAATSMAQSKLAELVATASWQSGDLQGDLTEQPPIYKWAAVAEDWEEPGLKQLSVTVTWPMNDKEQHVTVTTLVNAEGGL